MKITKKQLQEIIKEAINAITEEAPEEYRPWKEDVGDGMSELERLTDHLMYYVDQPMQDELYDTASQGLEEVISALVRLGKNGYDLVKTSEQKKVSLERLTDKLMYYVDQPMQDELYDAASQGLEEVISALVRLGKNGYDLVKTSEQKKVSELQGRRTWKGDYLKDPKTAMQNAFQHGAVLDDIIAIANDLNGEE